MESVLVDLASGIWYYFPYVRQNIFRSSPHIHEPRNIIYAYLKRISYKNILFRHVLVRITTECNLQCQNGGTFDSGTCSCSCAAGWALTDCASKSKYPQQIIPFDGASLFIKLVVLLLGIPHREFLIVLSELYLYFVTSAVKVSGR